MYKSFAPSQEHLLMLGSCQQYHDGSQHSRDDSEESIPLSRRTYERSEVTSDCSDEEEQIENEGKESIIKVLDHLPKWSYPKLVSSLAERFERKGMPIPLGVVAGQAIPLALFCCGIQWTFYVCYMLLTSHISFCNKEYEEDIEVAKYPWWSWTCVLPVLVASLCLEWSCLRWILVPKFQVLQQLKWTCIPCSSTERHFKLWLVASMALSALHVATFATDSAFLGTVIKTEGCTGGPKLELIWNFMLEKSTLRFLGGERLPSMRTFCFFVWSGAFLQLGYAWAESHPFRPEEPVDFEVAFLEDRKYRTEYSTLWRLLTCNEEKQNHGASLMVLAEVTGMCTLVRGDLDYALEKAKFQLEGKHHNFEISCLNHVRSQTVRSVLRTFLAGACCSATQLNLQITIMAMRSALTGEGIWPRQAQVLLSIFFASLNVIMRVIDCLNIMTKCWSWPKKILAAYEEKHSDQPLDQMHDIRFRKLLRNVRHSLYICILMALLCLFAVAYAWVKLGMAFRCEHSVWNVNGCVDLSQLVASFRENTTVVT